jgi:hypothetical protein
MIRYVEMRDDELFAWWNTETEVFICLEGNYAWNSWDEFISDAVHSRVPRLEIERYKRLLPNTAKDRNIFSGKQLLGRIEGLEGEIARLKSEIAVVLTYPKAGGEFIIGSFLYLKDGVMSLADDKLNGGQLYIATENVTGDTCGASGVGVSNG